jgi:HSP20 family molecular chaperone IbpA
MIKGTYQITIELPGIAEDKDQLTANGEFTVNSREELIDYLTQGVDAIQQRGMELLENHD